MKTILFILMIVLSLSPAAVAATDKCTQSFDGLAVLNIKNRRIQLEAEQVVQVRGDSARFVGLDDFGGELYQLMFNKNGMVLVSTSGDFASKKSSALKKVTSLPLTQQEFLQIMRFQRPPHFEETVVNHNIVWTHPQKKHLKVQFEGKIEFTKTKTSCVLPKHIDIIERKNHFKLDWSSLKAVDSTSKSH